MEFFVPTIDGEGRMPPDEAEAAWQACRKGAETDIGRDALAWRVYRLEYVHNGGSMEAVVGKPDPYEGRDLVMAIIAFSGLYSICYVTRGYHQTGAPIVGGNSVRSVEDFDTPTSVNR